MAAVDNTSPNTKSLMPTNLGLLTSGASARSGHFWHRRCCYGAAVSLGKIFNFPPPTQTHLWQALNYVRQILQNWFCQVCTSTRIPTLWTSSCLRINDLWKTSLLRLFVGNCCSGFRTLLLQCSYLVQPLYYIAVLQLGWRGISYVKLRLIANQSQKQLVDDLLLCQIPFYINQMENAAKSDLLPKIIPDI